MSNFQVDLTNCDREPIHIPGQIQSHGFLIVVDQECIIRFFSDNISTFIPGIEPGLLGKSLNYIENFLDIGYKPDFIPQLIRAHIGVPNFERVNPIPIKLLNVNYTLVISGTENYFLLEFEPALSDFVLDIQKVIGRSIAEIMGHKKLDRLAENTAIQVKKIINYDRVMIYRFAEDGHGEVMAEAKNDELESWLGLHYPASDIPTQARELYKLNLTRLIADVHTTPSKIYTSADNEEPLNLTYSQLRAVSPIHIQYLKNMGVASSFSISIICNGELWGLVACHNYTPRFIDYRSREYAKLIGQILSSAIEFREEEETHQQQQDYTMSVNHLVKGLQSSGSIETALTAGPVNLLHIVNAGGAMLVHENRRVKLGETPDDNQMNGLINWIGNHVKESVYHTNKLSEVCPEAIAYCDVASGILVITLSAVLREYIIWFKPELIKIIKWAGNPDKQVVYDANGLMNISPRHSFEAWSQQITATSQDWSAIELQSVTHLKDEIIQVVNQWAGTLRILNERLQQAYEELDTFSYTISHDLKNPLSAIKTYAQLLTRDQTIAERGQSMVQRIAERADQMNLMINAVLDYSKIGRSELMFRKVNTKMLIEDIVSDLHLVYDKLNLKITIGDTPDVHGDPIMMLQVFSNLIGNAVKYSQRSDPAEIHIEGRIDKKAVEYTITDNGLGIATDDLPRIFELFNRMDNVKDIEGSGVGLAIVKRIIEKHNGQIYAESELNKGSKFVVNFKMA